MECPNKFTPPLLSHFRKIHRPAKKESLLSREMVKLLPFHSSSSTFSPSQLLPSRHTANVERHQSNPTFSHSFPRFFCLSTSPFDQSQLESFQSSLFCRTKRIVKLPCFRAVKVKRQTVENEIKLSLSSHKYFRRRSLVSP